MRFLLLALAFGVCPVALGQSFQAGWYVVEPCATFNVTQAAQSDGDDLRQLSIMSGESVLAADRTADGVMVFEAHGRISLVRPESCLTRAPDGRPARLTENVQLLDRTLTTGSVVWVTGLDAGLDVVNVLVDGGERLNIPTRKVEFLRNSYFAQPNVRPGWRDAGH